MSVYKIVEWMRNPENKIPPSENRGDLETHRNRIAKVHLILPEHPDIDAAIERFISTLDFKEAADTITITGPDSDNRKYWYTEARKKSQPIWERLTSYLETKAGRNPEDILHLSRESDIVLGNLADPSAKNESRRGLVVGYVQSGKTANMSAVMAKAADAGYKCIIVLGGTLDTLRQQTQLRFDQELTGGGADTFQSNWKHLPRVVIEPSAPAWRRITSCSPENPKEGDIKYHHNIPQLISHGQGPVLFVIKKNPKRLEHLIRILQESRYFIDGKFTLPTLVIDDESDQASINIKANRAEIAGTNKAIRDLLKKLVTNTYVGYTATPFANVLIDSADEHELYGKDLFPEHFIVALDARDTYLGIRELFGVTNPVDVESDTPGLPVIAPISSVELNYFTNSRRAVAMNDVPEDMDLYQAILSFILSCAIRTHRRDGKKDMTMLIHPSSYTAIQDRVATPIRGTIIKLQEAIRNDVRWRELAKKLEGHYERDFIPRNKTIRDVMPDVPHLPSFDQLTDIARTVISDLEIKVLHSGSEDFLQYFDPSHPKRYIVVGGNKLSRGLTLEGLSISYFIRASKQYDTLIQMGRWFGHRRSYVDVTRIYMPIAMQQAFSELAFVEMDLREQFRQYMHNNARPIEMPPQIIKLRNLAVTAANRAGIATTISLDFSDRVVQQSVLELDQPKKIRRRNEQILAFLDRLGTPENGKSPTGRPRRGSWIWPNPIETKQLLSAFSDIDLGNIQKDLFFKFLHEQKKIRHWYVAVAGKEGAKRAKSVRFNGKEHELVTVDRRLKHMNVFSIRSLYSKGEHDDVIIPHLKRAGVNPGEVGIVEIYLLDADPDVLFSAKNVIQPPQDYLNDTPEFIAATAFMIPPLAKGVQKVGIKPIYTPHAEEDEKEIEGDE